MKFKSFCLFVTLLLIVTAITIQARDLKQVKVFIDDKEMLGSLNSLALDIVEKGDNYVVIMSTTDELKRVQQIGFRTEVIHEDIVGFYKERILNQHSIDEDMGGYMTLSEINSAVDFMITSHPTLISNKVIIGQTLEGRDIYALKISDNPNVEEDEPEVLYHSAIHAREVITPLVLLHFMDYLTDNYGTDPEVTDIVDNRQLWFVLNVNPDGYYHNEVTDPLGGGMWRKNRRDNGDGTFGVDLNRNYGNHWGYDDIGSSPTSSSETYRGTAPFSEPESQTMRDFIEAHEFVITVDYHAYSNLVLWPWGYDYLFTEDEDVFSLMGDSISAYNGYAPGAGWTLYLVNGDTGDWGYGEQTTKNKNLALLFEVGSSDDGFWPNPARIPTLIEENLAPNLFIAKVAGDIYQRVAPKPPTISVDNLVDIVSYDVNWSLVDTLNPAVEYELIEMTGYNVSSDSANNFDNWNNSGFLLSTIEYVSSPSSFYSDSGDGLFNTMTSNIPYLVLPNDSISFQIKFDIEANWDYGFIEISTDGQNYTTVEGNVTTSTNPNGNNRGHGITGSTNGNWIPAKFDISDYEGQYVYIRIVYQTDSYVVEDGLKVDDFYPSISFASTNVVSSVITDTFYTFTGQPTQSYFYKVRGKDAENQWSDFSDIVKTNVIFSTSDCFAVGDINNDGLALSVADLIFLGRYLNGSGPAPELPFSADMNGDCVISPADTVVYNDYFLNGLSAFPIYPIPTCCFVDIDRDGDGLYDSIEVALGTDHLDKDSDDDSILDIDEVVDPSNPLNTDGDALINALDPDDDGDGILTIDEIANGDSDLDGIPDYLDDDDDGDGILTKDDNCPLEPNPLQTDSDSDGLGDACDACCIGSTGNVDGDAFDQMDISDLVFLVSFMFQGGDAPLCMEEADVDGSGGETPVDISDIVAFVAYMFSSGLPPVPCP